jgi:hypothetical protein
MTDNLAPISNWFDCPRLDPPWRTIVSLNPLGSLWLEQGVLKIRASAHSFAFAERPLPCEVGLIQCSISLSTDNGAAWGPGLAVLWANRVLRVNVRRDGRFGFDDGSTSVYSGSIVCDGWNHVAIRIADDEVHIETSANGKLWSGSYCVPRCRFDGNPLALRIGKMGRHAKDECCASPGIVGECALTGLQILGQQTTRTWFQDQSEQQILTKPSWHSFLETAAQARVQS